MTNKNVVNMDFISAPSGIERDAKEMTMLARRLVELGRQNQTDVYVAITKGRETAVFDNLNPKGVARG